MLIRHLDEDEIEALIPPELVRCFAVEKCGVDFSVCVVVEHPETRTILEEIGEEDQEKMYEELAAIDAALDAAEADEELARLDF